MVLRKIVLFLEVTLIEIYSAIIFSGPSKPEVRSGAVRTRHEPRIFWH